MVAKLSIAEINSGPFEALNSLIERINTDGIEVTPAAAVADSVATDVETLVTDFNGLLASLRAAGFLAE